MKQRILSFLLFDIFIIFDALLYESFLIFFPEDLMIDHELFMIGGDVYI
jgi:hypothetical protein